MLETATIVGINKNIKSKSTTGIYHEIIFDNGKKIYLDPENRNYNNNQWWALIDNYPDTKGITLKGLKVKKGHCYNADYPYSIIKEKVEVKQTSNTNYDDLFEVEYEDDTIAVPINGADCYNCGTYPIDYSHSAYSKLCKACLTLDIPDDYYEQQQTDIEEAENKFYKTPKYPGGKI